MPINPDYKDLFSEFSAENVEFLVVGAHAVAYYDEPRYTKDLNIFVRPTKDNAARVWAALARYGAPLQDVSPDDFCRPGVVYQIGVEPNRIDIVMSIEAISFDDAWPSRVASTYGNVPIHIIGKTELIKNKRAVGRPQDLLDVDRLESR